MDTIQAVIRQPFHWWGFSVYSAIQRTIQ